ncbi:MAG: GNAT family N-acetyltransferase [Variovorax sp.]
MPEPRDYRYRPAAMKDAVAIANIHAASAHAALAALVPVADLRALAATTRSAKWREAIEFSEPQLQLAVTDAAPGGAAGGAEQCVGFVGYDRSRDPKTAPTVGEIWALYVLPDYWDQGFGVGLWDAAREGLQEEGCTSVTVWLPLKGERALRFFELAGFKRELSTARTTPVGSVRIEEIRLKRAL